MSAATANRDAKRSEGKLKSFAVATLTTIYKDTLVGVNAGGYLVNMSDAASLYFMGVAVEGKDNSAGANGALSCRVRRDGEFEFVYGGGDATIALVGEVAYLNDNQTVDEDPATATNEYPVGVIVEVVSTTKVRVDIAGAVHREGAQQAAITSLTDSSGGAATDNTIGAVTAPTAITNSSGSAASNGTIEAVTPPTALTDNGGGTADGTVASQAAPTTLTDNTGLSGSHDDTLAATAAPTTLTDNTGLSGSHDDTLAAVTTFTPSVAWNGSSVYPSAADATAIATAITVLNQNASDSAQKIIELVTLVGVLGQNDSDVAQKVIEMVTLAGTARDNLKEVTARQAENRTAIIALTDALGEFATAQTANRTAIVALTDAIAEVAGKVNTVISTMRSAGIIAS